MNLAKKKPSPDPDVKMKVTNYYMTKQIFDFSNKTKKWKYSRNKISLSDKKALRSDFLNNFSSEWKISNKPDWGFTRFDFNWIVLIVWKSKSTFNLLSVLK
jgi:hypothetical protein